VEQHLVKVACGDLAAETLSPSLRANGWRECAPDDRLGEAIHLSPGTGMDCFVAIAPRGNDDWGSDRGDGSYYRGSFGILSAKPL
jgi:hypothetical protein